MTGDRPRSTGGTDAHSSPLEYDPLRAYDFRGGMGAVAQGRTVAEVVDAVIVAAALAPPGPRFRRRSGEADDDPATFETRKRQGRQCDKLVGRSAFATTMTTIDDRQRGI